MKTSGTLLVLLSLGLLAGCSQRPAEPGAGSQTGSSSTAAPSHVMGPMATDIAPARLYARAPVNVISDEAWSTQALNPADRYADSYAPVASTHSESFHRMPAGAKGSYRIPVDTTDGESALFLSPQVQGRDAIDEAARNVDVLDPNGVKVNARQPKSADDPGGSKAMTMIPLAGHPAGVYTVTFHQPSRAAMAVEGSFAASNIVMKLKPTTLQHLLGNEQYVEATLTEAGKPILGAHVTSELVHGETLAELSPVTFTEVGGGVYRAPMHPLFNEQSAVSAYLTDVVAEGTSPKGMPFSRHGRTGFHFGVPTARVADVVSQRTLTDASGFISGFEVDVKIESSTLDRLEISAKMTATGPDGVEHPVSVAHYGKGFAPGTHLVTLHFDAGNIRMTRMEGDFMVRDLQIFSLGTNTLVSREAAGHNRIFPGIARVQLARHTTFSAAQTELVHEGILFDD